MAMSSGWVVLADQQARFGKVLVGWNFEIGVI